MKRKRMLAIAFVLFLCLVLGYYLAAPGTIQGPGDFGNFKGYCYKHEFGEIMTGKNKDSRQDRYLTVCFAETSGPLEVEVQVLSKEPKDAEYSPVETFSVKLSEGRTAVIPAGNDFQVTAKTTEGQQGTGIFVVILSEAEVK